MVESLTKKVENDWLSSVINKSDTSDSKNTDPIHNMHQDLYYCDKNLIKSLGEESLLFTKLSNVKLLGSMCKFGEKDFDRESWSEYTKSVTRIYRTKHSTFIRNNNS